MNLRVLLALLALVLGGCARDPVYPEPEPPPQPIEPDPVDPVDPVDPTVDVLAPFKLVKVGDDAERLAALPGTPVVVTVGPRTIHAWTTTKRRAVGGFITWEVHVEAGRVTATFPW